METVYVRDIVGHNISTITNESKRFSIIKEYIENSKEPEILLDFTRIEMIEPYKDPVFLDIIRNPRVTIKLYNKENMAKSIKFMLKMTDFSDEEANKKVISVVVKLEDEPSRNDLELKRLTDALKSTVVESEDKSIVEIKVAKRMSTINRINAIVALKNIAEEYRKTASKIVFDFTGVTIPDDVIDTLSNLCYDLRLNGINLEVLSSQEVIKEKINTFISMGNKRKMSVAEKIHYIDTELKINSAGLLTSYVKGKKKDIFGRKGNGEVAKTLPAIYRGHDDTYIYFDTFKASTFMTRFEYERMNDGERHPNLKVVKEKIEIAKLGLCAICVGSEYHFNLPVQFDSGIKKVPVLTENGVEYRSLTLPQHMKLIFDDFCIKYDVTTMLQSIAVTKQNMRKIGIYL